MNGSDRKPQSNTGVAQAWRLERFKIGFQYALTLAAALVMGWLLPHLWGNTIADWQMEAIEKHFSLPFASLSTVSQALSFVASFAAPTLLCFLIVFLFSFSSLNCLINNGVLVYLGMRTGYTFSVLIRIVTQVPPTAYQPGWICLGIFVIFKFALLLLIFRYAFRSSEYSYYLRMYSQSGRALFHPRTVCMLMGYSILISIAVFAAHALYGWFLYIL